MTFVCSLLDYNCSDALHIVKINYAELMRLRIDPMLSSLFAKKVIALQQKHKMEQFPLSTQKMMYLLDNIIIPTLKINIIGKFQAFLDVMEQSNDPLLINMAKKLSM